MKKNIDEIEKKIENIDESNLNKNNKLEKEKNLEKIKEKNTNDEKKNLKRNSNDEKIKNIKISNIEKIENIKQIFKKNEIKKIDDALITKLNEFYFSEKEDYEIGKNFNNDKLLLMNLRVKKDSDYIEINCKSELIKGLIEVAKKKPDNPISNLGLILCEKEKNIEE